MDISTEEILEQLDSAVERLDEIERFTKGKWASNGTLGDIKEFLISKGFTHEYMAGYDFYALANLLHV